MPGQNTGGSQFFINLVDKIGKVKTNAMDRPLKEIKILSAKIIA